MKQPEKTLTSLCCSLGVTLSELVAFKREVEGVGFLLNTIFILCFLL